MIEVTELVADQMFGAGSEAVVVHVGQGAQAPERVSGLPIGGGGRDLCAVAGQGCRECFDGRFGVGGFGGQDAVRVLLAGGQVDVVFVAAAG
ncbi:Uncharacterised protein [Mycobacteroides abscessus subsp. abscessus]|nr:Uncharacterised protein [Mycobacteroides abscessus subsp. abscessus]SKO50313.1 Uncharacterised protein [Mycobacteroides abscessus subsp. abscessus]